MRWPPISSRDGIYKVAQRIIITYNSGNDLVVVVSAPKEEPGRLVSHAGVASRMFATLAYNNINIQMISTSDIKIAVAIEEKYTELAVRVLHETFIPDGKASSIYMN